MRWNYVSDWENVAGCYNNFPLACSLLRLAVSLRNCKSLWNGCHSEAVSVGYRKLYSFFFLRFWYHKIQNISDAVMQWFKAHVPERRQICGLLLLILANVLWVAAAEISRVNFKLIWVSEWMSEFINIVKSNFRGKIFRNGIRTGIKKGKSFILISTITFWVVEMVLKLL